MLPVDYSRRAIADLHKAAAESLAYGEAVAAEVESHMREVVARISLLPRNALVVKQRPGRRVVSLVRYPYKIFYRILKDRIRILHIRHTSRQDW